LTEASPDAPQLRPGAKITRAIRRKGLKDLIIDIFSVHQSLGKLMNLNEMDNKTLFDRYFPDRPLSNWRINSDDSDRYFMSEVRAVE
jgi:hypothetical protein